MLLCGHCEYKTSIWPNIVHHINKSDMHKAHPCKTWYEFRKQTQTIFQPPVQSSQSTFLTILSSTKYQSFMSLPSEDILPVAAAVARLAPSEVTADVLADVEPNASLLLHLPPPHETPRLP